MANICTMLRDDELESLTIARTTNNVYFFVVVLVWLGKLCEGEIIHAF